MLFFLILIVLLNTFLVFFYDKLDRLINIYDTPDSLRKFHKGKVPLTGGFLIFFNLIFFSFIDFILGYKIFFFEDLFNYNRIYFSFIFGLIAFFSLGLLDDKKTIFANVKLVIQILIIFIILLLDPNLKIEFLRIGFLNKNFALNEFSLIFTILCFLLFINAFNMFDGINGQSGFYTALNLLIFYLVSNQPVFLLFLIIVTIFLYRNIKNKFFLGNSGSYFLAYLISFYFIKFYNVGIIKDSDFIFLAMLIPGIDMLRLFFLRIYKGSSPFKADRNHFHHILLREFSYINSMLILICFMCLPLIINYIFDKIFLIIFLTLISYFLLLYKIKIKIKN